MNTKYVASIAAGAWLGSIANTYYTKTVDGKIDGMQAKCDSIANAGKKAANAIPYDTAAKVHAEQQKAMLVHQIDSAKVALAKMEARLAKGAR